jgi:hypothetical protein
VHISTRGHHAFRSLEHIISGIKKTFRGREFARAFPVLGMGRADDARKPGPAKAELLDGRKLQFGPQAPDWRIVENKVAAIKPGKLDNDRKPQS